jgi:excisionase family DNA binding protein
MITKFHCLSKPELEKIKTEYNLTDDEKSIVELLRNENSYEQIAQRMCCSTATIGRKIRKINDKIERSEKIMRTKIPIWEKINLSVEEAAEYSNIGINKLYEMIKEPSCPFVLYVGKKAVIKRKEFERYLEKVSSI